MRPPPPSYVPFFPPPPGLPPKVTTRRAADGRNFSGVLPLLLSPRRSIEEEVRYPRRQTPCVIVLPFFLSFSPLFSLWPLSNPRDDGKIYRLWRIFGKSIPTQPSSFPFFLPEESLPPPPSSGSDREMAMRHVAKGLQRQHDAGHPSFSFFFYLSQDWRAALFFFFFSFESSTASEGGQVEVKSASK